MLKVYDVFQTLNNTYIITEFCSDGDLKEQLSQRSAFPEGEATKILIHLLNGFKEMTEKHIVHRDLKPANILLNRGVPKIADFGFAKDLDAEPCKFIYNVGTPMYMSPEALKHNQYSPKSDIWSLGAMYYELIYGTTPFHASTEKELCERITHDSVNFPSTPFVSQLSKDFIRQCLEVDTRKRLDPQ